MTRINPIDRIVSALAMGLMHLLWLGLGRPLDRTSFGRPLHDKDDANGYNALSSSHLYRFLDGWS